jgi:hypothetical protein
MLSINWIFVGVLTGFLIVAVFVPPARKQLHLPTPGDKDTYFTGKGCVKFRAEEVSCTKEATSLNLLACENK